MALPCKHEERMMKNADLSGRNVRVVVDVTGPDDALVLSIDPWSNCPFETAKEEGRFCNECEFWGSQVRGVDWAEFSLCLYEKHSRRKARATT